MIVYSKKIIKFCSEIKIGIKEILTHEIGLEVTESRFYNFDQTHSHPIVVVIYNNKSMLGYFNSDFLELGFNESLMRTSKSQLYNIIRHELAHYLMFLQYGKYVQHHGIEFRAFCKKYGWGEEVYNATTALESDTSDPVIIENQILRRVQKLMSLASSSNKNEAEQAMIKSQQLLLKYNIEAKDVEDDGEEKIYLKRIMKQKKENAKMRAIARILETFFVNIVYNRTNEFIYIEVLGNIVNVEIAEYVANFLNFEMDNLWKHARLNTNLTGVIAKNSFFLGLAKGYCNKIQEFTKKYEGDILNALITIENKLIEAKTLVYPRLTKTKSQGNFCQKSSDIGEKMGRQLNIKPGIEKSEHSGRLIAFTT